MGEGIGENIGEEMSENDPKGISKKKNNGPSALLSRLLENLAMFLKL